MSQKWVRAEKARALLRLQGELREMRGDAMTLRQHALEGLCQIVGAAVGMLAMATDHQPGMTTRILDYNDCGYSDSDRASLLRHLVEHGASSDPCIAKMSQREANIVALRSDDLLPGRAWYETAYVNEYLYPARLDKALHCRRATDQPEVVHGMTLQRCWGDRAFTEEDCSLLELFQQECGWIYDVGSHGVDGGTLPGVQLPPRLRSVLEQLLTGASEKQIADQLGLTPQTLHQYVKAVYRAANVRSRAELIVRGARGPR
jgi:DNA-binding CsgD family transcriptional regulator